jgi:hypothetical protein
MVNMHPYTQGDCNKLKSAQMCEKNKIDRLSTHLELAVYFKYEFAQRRRPARRRTMQYAAATSSAERGRTEGDAPELGHAWVRREPEHVLRRVWEGRGPEKLREFGVECREYVEKRQESLGIIEGEGLCFFRLASADQDRGAKAVITMCGTVR